MSDYGQKLDKQTRYAVAGGIFLLAIAVLLFQAWILMLLLGALSTFTFLPALGYWQTVLVIMFINFVAGLIKRASG
jgi:uncharacterized membrane protein